MITILPLSNRTIVTKAKPVESKPEPSSNHRAIAYTLAGAAAFSGIIYGIVSHNKNAAIKEVETAVDPIKKVFENQMEKFPKDIDYRKTLAKAAGIKETDYYKLRPIAGPEEYASIVKDFNNSPIHYTPGETLITDKKDNYLLKGVENKTYRASMHTHTVHSDGKLTIQELLDKGAKYADEVFEANKDNPDFKAKNAPFTIAITDHDTFEGCKEAIKLIADNPEKYKNLRVVLGSELSVENRMLGSRLKTPVPIHMTVLGINPYGEEITKLLDDQKENRAVLMKKLIKDCSEIEPELKDKFDFEEAENLYPFLKYKIASVCYPMKDYFQYKIIFSECFEKNTELKNELKNAGVKTEEIDYSTFFKNPLDKLKVRQPEFYLNYYSSLTRSVAKLLKITPEEAEAKMPLNDSIKPRLKNVETMCLKEAPKMDLQPAYLDMEKAIETIKKEPYGYMSWAHPGCTEIGKALKDSDSFGGMETIFRVFKEKGGDRAFSTEIYYPYFGELGESTEWLNSLTKYAESNKLYFSGGLDTHGKNIFYSNKS